MARKKRTSRDDTGISLNAAKAGENATLDDFKAYERAEVPGVSLSTNLLDDAPSSTAFDRARKLAKQNYWLRAYMRTSCNVHNFGLTFTSRPSDATQPTPEQVKTANEGLKEWLAIEAPVAAGTVSESDRQSLGVASGAMVSNEERVRKFIADCWYEYLLLENLIVGWIKGTETASILAPERCIYKDVMGVETLQFIHGLGSSDLKLLDPKQQEIFKDTKLIFDPQQGTYFRVLKTQRTGSGLSFPSVQSIFRTLATMDSIEIGESSYAFGGRMKFRHWQVGHKIESGPHAGKSTHFWKKLISTTIRGIFSGKRGHLGDYVGNFDQELKYPHEELDYYEKKKWESVEHRLMKWGGPLAHMMDATGLVPFLTPLLRSEVTLKRTEFGQFIASVINQSFGIPDGIRIELNWSNEHFWDSKTFAELLKQGLAGGPISQSTFRQSAGFDDAREMMKKEMEAEDCQKNRQKYMPAFDAAHGDQLDKGGKPSGGTDADNVNAA